MYVYTVCQHHRISPFPFVFLYYQQQNFRLVKTESICRPEEFKLDQMTKFYCNRLENMVGKGKNAGYQHFLLFPQCFQKASCSEGFEVGIKGLKTKTWVRQPPVKRHFSY